jgi:hypothetical protein
LTKFAHPPSSTQLAGATIQGQITGFNTDDPTFTCFNGKALNVYADDKQFPGVLVVFSACPSSTSSGAGGGITGAWTFVPPKQSPSPYTYQAMYAGRILQLTEVEVKGSLPTGAVLLSQVTQFSTTDPAYNKCLIGASLRVWSAQKAYPGQYLVFGGCPGGPPALWTFSVTYNYSATWQSIPQPLTPVPSSGTLPPDAVIQGQVVNFTTDDPSFACQNGQALNVYAAPTEFSGKLLVVGGCPNSIPGAWTFPSSGGYTYSAMWKSKTVKLNVVSPVPGNAAIIPNTYVSNFKTNDPQYQCFNGAFLQVWRVSDYPPNQYLVYDVCGTGIFGAWNFTEGVGP